MRHGRTCSGHLDQGRTALLSEMPGTRFTLGLAGGQTRVPGMTVRGSHSGSRVQRGYPESRCAHCASDWIPGSRCIECRSSGKPMIGQRAPE